MCTSIIYTANGQHYFGRNLDLEISFGEHPVITPRNYVFKYRKLPNRKATYAMIGMAIVKDNYPLYFDAANEKGLGIAGLNFDGPCHYFSESAEKDNVAPFELIPYLLSQYTSVEEVKNALKNINLVDINFSEKLQVSPLHWLIADKTGKSIVVESTVSGLHVYDNPVSVLTNNPEFPEQVANLANYIN
ncbi:MAG: linear amide C-N hydrolase, partial [Lactobacillus paragasseri]